MPVNKEDKISVTIVGGGISGIAQAIHLKRRLGDKLELHIFEKKNEAGGVWRDSQWPGAGVDVPIHLYQLYSDLNPWWPDLYAKQPDADASSDWQSLISKYDLRPHFRYAHEFESARWDDEASLWVFQFRHRGEIVKHSSNVFVSAVGPFHKANLGVKNHEKFQGISFHSQDWRNVDFINKRVAVVGNGSTGVQVAANLAKIDGVQLTHFIRSGGYYNPKVNTKYPNWLKWTFAYVPFANVLHRFYIFTSWEKSSLANGNAWWQRYLRRGKEAKMLDYLKKTAPEKYHHALIPKYAAGLKRVAWDEGWFASLHRDNVKLRNVPIEEADESGLRLKDGEKHDFDIIIYATGYDVAGYGVGLNENVYGADGTELATIWQKDTPQAHLGVATPNYPNLFFLVGPNALSTSWGYTIGNQTLFISKIIEIIQKERLLTIEPKQDVFEAYNKELNGYLEESVYTTSGERSWYRFKGTGKPTVPSGFTAVTLWWKTAWVDYTHWVGRDRNGKQVNLSSRLVARRLLQALTLAGIYGAYISYPQLKLLLN
ncbi:FAD/NAD(P)-binding domain-containing protein [Wallemia mellicola]|nr:FAD/NAD(P)-binding domain-containing protein [Wallemia mellicola]